MMEIPTRYDFKSTEKRIYQLWRDRHCFDSVYDRDGKPRSPDEADKPRFTIAIPPPNVTGRLHMGHALNNTIQDVLIRYKRMDGYDALWLPGTDHAGISTQTVVRKHLDAEGVDYRELGRDKFIEKAWEWKKKFGDMILTQLEKLGCSCDWRRTCFTMDDGPSRGVRTVFKALYDRGLLYRGKRIVNWCPVDQTALSDDEVNTKDGGEPGHLWHIRYPLVEPGNLESGVEHLTVATTRPETLFGDVAVAVHPEDDRYRTLIGKQVRLPLQGRLIPIITDDYVDREFGTGCLKITPAHDANDFDVGQRHDLEPINVMNSDATMNDVVPERFRGLDRYQARAEAVKALEEEGLLDKIEDRMVPIGRAQRSGAPIEYRLSDQWFVRMKPLAEKALEASGYRRSRGGDGWEKKGESGLFFHPPRWEKIYYAWLTNIRDWTISRQIWWGHRIPAWFHKETGEIAVDVDTPKAVRQAPDEWYQDPDVLDTWFSSWLWPMTTLGWPDQTKDFERYFPTSVLSTSKDIIFFWVARMNFSGLEMTGKLPYPGRLHPSDGARRSWRGHEQEQRQRHRSARRHRWRHDRGSQRPHLRSASAQHERAHRARGQELPPTGSRPSVRMHCGSRWSTHAPKGRRCAYRFTVSTRLGAVSLPSSGTRAATYCYRSRQPPATTRARPSRVSKTTGSAREPHRRHAKFAPGSKGTTSRPSATRSTDSFGTITAIGIWSSRNPGQQATTEPAARRAAHELGVTLAEILRMLHPVAPFITEELWGKLLEPMDTKKLWLGKRPESDLLILERAPKGEREPDAALEDTFESLQRLVSRVRTSRASSARGGARGGARIPDNVRLNVAVKPRDDALASLLEKTRPVLSSLANLESLAIVDAKPDGAVTVVDPAFELYVDLGSHVDIDAELKRIEKESADLGEKVDASHEEARKPQVPERR